MCHFKNSVPSVYFEFCSCLFHSEKMTTFCFKILKKGGKDGNGSERHDLFKWANEMKCIQWRGVVTFHFIKIEKLIYNVTTKLFHFKFMLEQLVHFILLLAIFTSVIHMSLFQACSGRRFLALISHSELLEKKKDLCQRNAQTQRKKYPIAIMGSVVGFAFVGSDTLWCMALLKIIGRIIIIYSWSKQKMTKQHVMHW